MSASVISRWSTWSAQALAAMSCPVPFRVGVLAIADGPGNAPLLVCGGWGQPVRLIDPAGEIQARDLSGPLYVTSLMTARTGSGRIVAWRDLRGGQVWDLDRPDARLGAGRTRRPSFDLLAVADVGGRPVVVASERGRWSRETKTWLRDAETGQVIGELPASRGPKYDLRAVTITSSAVGEPLLIIGEPDGQVSVWDVPDVRLRQAFRCPAPRSGTSALAAPVTGGGPAGNLTIVASAWHDVLSCWQLETGELLHSTKIRFRDVPAGNVSQELVIGRIGTRAVIAGLSSAGPVAFDAGSGAPVPLLAYDREPTAAAALRAAPSGIVHAAASGRQVRCHLLREAPDDAGETGVQDVAVSAWPGRAAVLSADFAHELRVRDLRTGELLERRNWPRSRSAGAIAGRIVSCYDRGQPFPVDLLTGEQAAPQLQVSWGSLYRAWWGSPDGEDQVAVGVLYKSIGGTEGDSYTLVRIAVWDGLTGQLRSLRDTGADSMELALAIGTVGGDPALASAERGHGLTAESLAADPVRRGSRLSRPRWQARRPSGLTGNAVAMLGDGSVACGEDDGIVRVLRCVRSGAGARLEDVAQIDVGAQVNALAHAGEGQLVIGCGAGVQLVEIAQPAQ